MPGAREFVLDASAILAVLQGEEGSAEISGRVHGGMVSAVNLAEVVARLHEGGGSEEEVRRTVARLQLLEIPFDPSDAWRTGLLRRRTRSAGLSLADRACISLAVSRGVPALTMDAAWGRLGLGNAVRVVRR